MKKFNRIHDREQCENREEALLSSIPMSIVNSMIAGQPVVFEWRIYAGHTWAQLLDEVQKMLQSDRRIRSTSRIGSSFCRCTTTRGATMMCANKIQRTYLRLPNYFWQDGGPSSDREKNKRCGTLPYKPDGKWDSTADVMMKNRCLCSHQKQAHTTSGDCTGDVLDQQCQAQEPALRRSQRALE